jgi:protein phosphatase PTC7
MQVQRVKQWTDLSNMSLPRHSRFMSSLPRPYRFHVGASWAGKPVHPRDKQVNTKPFADNHPIALWRDHVLSRPNGGGGKHIGEDFFYVQEVCPQTRLLP